MDILYRRFALVAAFIAAMGALTANLIQETRTADNRRIQTIETLSPADRLTCRTMKLCATGNGLVSFHPTV